MGARYLLTVRFLKTNSGKKGEGMPVVRNPQFYFREHFFEYHLLYIAFYTRPKLL